MLKKDSDILLGIVLNHLVPAEDEWPGAGEEILLKAMIADSKVDNELHLIEEILAHLSDAFENNSAKQQVEELQMIETTSPQAFSSLLRHTYNVYYSNANVLNVLEVKSGYPARPPLFQGYELEPFNPESLNKQKQRAPFWRKVR
jgi:hypothetical protein